MLAFVNETTGTIVDGEPEIDSPQVCNTFKLTETTALNYFFGFQRANETFLGKIYFYFHYKIGNLYCIFVYFRA
jgi:hypothetical protein